jgi:hypothetical protein
MLAGVSIYKDITWFKSYECIYINLNLRFNLTKHTAMNTYGEVEAQLHAYLSQNKFNVKGLSPHWGNVPHVTTQKKGWWASEAVWTLCNGREEERSNSFRKYWRQLLPHGIPKSTMRNIDHLENPMSAFKKFLILMLMLYKLTTILQSVT